MRISLLIIILILALSGCVAPSQTILPTSTPLPTAIVATRTPTFTPPPTVTSYPTGNMIAQTPSLMMTNEIVASDEDDISQETPVAAAPVITAIPEHGPILFSSDFSVGWPAIETDTSSVNIVNGQYLFEVGPFDGTYITTTSVSSGAYFVEVDIFPEQCPAKAGYGLLFNYRDSANYYVFTIYCDGRFTIAGRQAGAIFDVGISSATIPGGITSASGNHTVGIISDNGDFSLLFDNIILAMFSDTRHPDGDVAIYVTSQGSEVIRAAFDNLSVFSLD